MQQQNNIPDYLQDTYNMVCCAFPDRIPTEDYWPLIALLHPEMSYRALARVLAVIMGKSYFEILNDTQGFGVDHLPGKRDIERVRQRLLSCDFEEWLQKQF